MNETILMQIGKSGLRMASYLKWTSLGVRRSKMKVTQHRNRSQKSVSARYLKNYPVNFDQTQQAHNT